MYIKKITCGIIDNNNYVLIKGNDCLIVDLSDFDSIDKFIDNSKLNVLGILLTHTHWDHLLGVEKFIEKYKVPVYLSSNRPNYIMDAHFDYTIKKYGIKIKFDIDKIELRYLDEGKQKIENFEFFVIDTPGHTTCSIVYYFQIEKAMFTGDFLFKRTIGITNTQLSDKRQMKESLNKIKTYPSDINIYPGHGENTNLKYEKIHNMYLIR
ncbi:MBL fold metallo-hydrolase [Psychrilyobacter sp.]|uniref:MBL fold metallo-hydrolase n=1 Tax=Psychrilyobacter sp. TaxID=2586924 RepID=UPI003019126E